jgi:Zn-finger nucleic acid-binding protein
MYRDRVMRCDACTADLVQYGERDKWRCPKCSSVVIASAELERELGALGAGLSETLDTSRLLATTRACPTCDTGMNQLSIDGVVIERCPKDHTLWFEAGELGKIRAKLTDADAESVLVRVWDRWFRGD